MTPLQRMLDDLPSSRSFKFPKLGFCFLGTETQAVNRRLRALAWQNRYAFLLAVIATVKRSGDDADAQTDLLSVFGEPARATFNRECVVTITSKNRETLIRGWHLDLDNAKLEGSNLLFTIVCQDDQYMDIVQDLERDLGTSVAPTEQLQKMLG